MTLQRSDTAGCNTATDAKGRVQQKNTFITLAKTGGFWPAARWRLSSSRKMPRHFPEFVPLSNGVPFARCKWWQGRRAARISGLGPCYASIRYCCHEREDGGFGLFSTIAGGACDAASAWEARRPASCGSCSGLCWQSRKAGIRSGGCTRFRTQGPATGFLKSYDRAAARDTCTDLLYNRRPFWRHPSSMVGPVRVGRFCKRQANIAAGFGADYRICCQLIDC